MRKKLQYSLIFLALFSLLPASSLAKVYKVEEVPNVHLQDKTQYVSDPEHLLSPQALSRVNNTLAMLEDSTTVETAFVIVDDIGQADIYDFTLALSRNWGVGKKDKNNGVVVVFALNQREVRIQTGSGVEGVLPDVAARRLIDRDVIPNMKNGDLDGAVSSLSSSLYQVFTNPEAAAELRSEQDDFSPKEILKILLFFCIVVTIIAFFLLGYTLWNMRKMNTYRRALMLRESGWVFIILSVVSLGGALIPTLIYFYLARYYREKRRKCDVCGTQMNKLSETEDNAYLTKGQDTEEQLKSVDYDVWLCPKCGTTEIFPFVSKSTKYRVCPACHSRSQGLLYDRVEVQPTHSREGKGVKVYQCKNCNHKDEEHYTIPKKETVVYVGGGGRGFGGGGGGISGGSWGGGGFSGGGASGRW